MMKSTGGASDGIVHQVLTKDNYERWKIVMQNYLQGQGLWDVVIQNADTRTDQASKKMKDGQQALHFFQLSSCKPDFLETVKKSSWNNFTNQNGPDSRATPDLEQGQGLLGVIQTVSEFETDASWKIKDVKALHIIQLSCGREIADEISHFKTAKSAWNHLGSLYGKDLTAGADHEQDVDHIHSPKNKELFWKVMRGTPIGNIGMDSDVYMTSASRSSLLHAAVIAGNVENVELLVKVGKDKLICMQDEHGDTALALVARYTGNTDIAKCMVEEIKGLPETLLEKENNDNVIPILLAAANGHKELTSYLYSKTPIKSKVFDKLNSHNRVLLLSLCITAEIFDVALRLLRRFNDLPEQSLSVYNFSVPTLLRESLSLPSKISESDPLQQSLPDKFSALVALAKMPTSFPSGTRSGFLGQIIYENLNVERSFNNEYDIAEIGNFVRKVTCVADAANERPQKISSAVQCGIGRKVMNFVVLIMLSGWRFCKLLVSMFLFWPVKLLGRLLCKIFHGVAYLLVQVFHYLDIKGIRKIYDQKYTHYEVIGILSYFCRSVGKFNSSKLKEASAYEAMLHASQHGIIEFINAMRDANPNFLSAVDSCHRGIFSYAILHRKQNVFQLIHSVNGRKEILRHRIDSFGNNLLHLAAHLGPSSDRHSRSGAALQMQREIQWFKAVEKVLHPKFKEAENDDGKKPYEIFIESHEELVKEGEKWAKDTATSYTIVGTLITTIMFAAAFTVPGGNDDKTGLPIFLHDNIFTAFLMADAVSLFASASSVLIFIGILTSRYAEKDFLKSLPWKLLFGLLLLFLSVCSMIVAFSAAIIDMILKGYETHKWFIVVPIMALGSIPIIVLVISQVSFMYESLRSTWKNPIRSINK